MTQPHALKDLTGMTFGRLTVIRRNGSDSYRAAQWLCRCECGTEKTIHGAPLRKGVTVSCGCYGAEARSAAHTTHGGARRGNRAPGYDAWRAMRSRCENPKDANFKHYGERGISVGEEWADFSAFVSDMGPRPFPAATIERRDNSQGYNPENCYWATMTQQARNRRSNVPVVRSDGARYATMVEAAEAVGVHPTGIRAACTGKQKQSGGYGWEFALLTALTSPDTDSQENGHE